MTTLYKIQDYCTGRTLSDGYKTLREAREALKAKNSCSAVKCYRIIVLDYEDVQ